VAELESYLPYDSYGMRQLAAALQQQGRTLGTAAGEIDGASSSMQFDAPAGDRIRHGLAAAVKQLTGAADELDGTARQLLTAAQNVDDQNAAIARHNQHVLDAMPPLERKLVLENQ
jgi:hypothetical protein